MHELLRAHPRFVLGFALLAAACAANPPPASPGDATADAEPEPTAQPAPAAQPEAEGDAPVEGSSEPSDPSLSPAPTASGPRDSRGKEEIQQVVANNREKVRACYDAALAQNPGIHGDLVISFVIDPRGDVKQAEVSWSESDLHIPELDTCAVDAVRTFKFPASSRGLESKVSYPFNFNPPRPDSPAAKPSGSARE